MVVERILQNLESTYTTDLKLEHYSLELATRSGSWNDPLDWNYNCGYENMRFVAHD